MVPVTKFSEYKPIHFQECQLQNAETTVDPEFPPLWTPGMTEAPPVTCTQQVFSLRTVRNRRGREV